MYTEGEKRLPLRTSLLVLVRADLSLSCRCRVLKAGSISRTIILIIKHALRRVARFLAAAFFPSTRFSSAWSSSTCFRFSSMTCPNQKKKKKDENLNKYGVEIDGVVIGASHPHGRTPQNERMEWNGGNAPLQTRPDQRQICSRLCLSEPVIYCYSFLERRNEKKSARRVPCRGYPGSARKRPLRAVCRGRRAGPP